MSSTRSHARRYDIPRVIGAHLSRGIESSCYPLVCLRPHWSKAHITPAYSGELVLTNNRPHHADNVVL